MIGHSGNGVIQRLHHLLANELAAEQGDVDLLRRFTGQADDGALAAIVRRHGPMVLGVCRRLLRNSADADDAFQATFAVLIRKAASLSRPERLAGWLFQVAYRTARRARTRRWRQQSRQMPLHDIPVDAPIADIVWRELQPIFDEEVNRLPDKLRLPVVLCFMEGRTKRAAAQALGWPEGTFSSRLQQARELLRARLARRGVTVSAGAFALALVQGMASAAVPVPLISATVQSAKFLAAGSALAGPVAALTQGVLHSMFITKLKIVAIVALTVGVLGGGTGWVFQDRNGSGGWARARAEQPGEKSSGPNADRPDKKAADELERTLRLNHLALEQAWRRLHEAEAAAVEAQATLRLKNKELDRMEQLFALGAIDKASLEHAAAEDKLARAQMGRAQAALRRAMQEAAARAEIERQINEDSAPAKPQKTPPTDVVPPNKVLSTDVLVAEALVREREADLAVAEAKIAFRQFEVAQFEKLAKLKAVTQSLVDKTKAEWQLAEAEVKRARAALESAKATLAHVRDPASKESAPIGKKEVSVSDAEMQLERLLKLKANGFVTEAEVERARITVAQARIASELRTIVDLRQREVDRARKLLELKAITAEELEKAVDALDAAKRRLADWK